ncbi:hypothetical protein F5Y00DRAFT_265763 [Daldinia vernicosa]|uniref:uncharacterized protein n=1 Tax=Daldinia vernicosa TaxID=114800 RepID=UPI002007CD75|nr:uncharacterized protein F5Y00DRAFT_265763 [Daldinia vernicosa]KAI0845228.1 hypothetical protein F5Y00DRAFT_265763 [Daldinia vernicosa]
MSNWGNARSVGGKAGYQGGGNTSSGSFSGPDFNNLYLQKRSTDKESIKRRESISNQYNTGFIGKMWKR